MTFWASPSFMASRLPVRTAEALFSPPRSSEPPAGIERFLPLAAVSSAVPAPSTVMESSVCAVLPLLNTVAEIAAGPVDSSAGWVMTTAFWILMSPTVVAALSGLTPRVWALLPAAHAESEAIENAMAAAARAPRRRLLLTAAATP